MLGFKSSETQVEFDGNLPLGQGLGGSAALAVALLRALGYTDQQELQDRAHALERLSHGSPSGIDDTVVSWGKPVFFVKGKGAQLLEPSPGFRLWVATTGKKGSTKVAVDNASSWRGSNMKAFDRMNKRVSQLATEGRVALETGAFDSLGKKMSENHRLLSELGVSTPQLDALVDAAMRAGAWGSKLTGAGLGGAMIALAPEECDLRAALLDAGAHEVIAP
jgi:mevalonate kinase